MAGVEVLVTVAPEAKVAAGTLKMGQTVSAAAVAAAGPIIMNLSLTEKVTASVMCLATPERAVPAASPCACI